MPHPVGGAIGGPCVVAARANMGYVTYNLIQQQQRRACQGESAITHLRHAENVRDKLCVGVASLCSWNKFSFLECSISN